MVRLVCALVDLNKPNGCTATYTVDVELTIAVRDLFAMIKPGLERQHGSPLGQLELYSAKQENGLWPSSDVVHKMEPRDIDCERHFMAPFKQLSVWFGGAAVEPPPSDRDQVHVLVVSISTNS